MTYWVDGNDCDDIEEELEVLVRHCNKDLKEPDQVVRGTWGDDGFYLSDGGELSFNWDIIKWRLV